MGSVYRRGAQVVHVIVFGEGGNQAMAFDLWPQNEHWLRWKSETEVFTVPMNNACPLSKLCSPSVKPLPQPRRVCVHVCVCMYACSRIVWLTVNPTLSTIICSKISTKRCFFSWLQDNYYVLYMWHHGNHEHEVPSNFMTFPNSMLLC